MVCSELRVVVLARGGGRVEARVLRDIVGSAHAHEPSALESRAAFPVVPERADQVGDVVGVAGDDLKKAVLTGDERLVVDPHRIWLSEARFAALSEKAAGS